VIGDLKSVQVRNWLCYRDPQEIDVPLGATSVVARRVSDPESSNWTGKTSLLSAVVFGVVGNRPACARVNDDMITEGEAEMQVRLVFDGLTIDRSLKRGSTIKLTATWYDEAGNEVTASGPRAQERILELVGLSEPDFLAANYFEQKQMSRLVKLSHSDLLELFVGWFKLDRLQAAIEVARERSKPVAAKVSELKQKIATLDSTIAGVSVGDLGEALERVKEADAKYGAIQAQIDEHAALVVAQLGATKYDEALGAARALKAEIEKVDENALVEARDWAIAARDDARLAHSTADRERVDAERRAVGGLDDGMCPVMREKCPAVVHVDAVLSKNRQLVQDERQKAAKLSQELSRASAELGEVQSALDQHVALKRRFEALAAEAKRYRQDKVALHKAGALPDLTEVRAALDAAAREANDAKIAFGAMQQAKLMVERLTKDQDKATLELGATASDLAVLVAARQIFTESLRVTAEENTGEVSSLANAALAEAGIDLSIEVQWAREAKGLTDVCDACGFGYPATAKVKACQRCGAQRGPKVVFEPRIVLSDVSGAADDLAGVMFQLSAAAWLRRDRGSSWGLALVDEPFGSLDAPLRRKLATCFAEQLGSRYGVRQALVVAHDLESIDAMPNRIKIVAREEGSAFE